MARDYYALLGIPRSATTREIRSGYQWAAAKWHPQKNPAAKVEAQSRFRDIAEAYDVLIDPLRRQRYDAYGEVGLKNPPYGLDFDPYQYVGDPFELFKNFFSSADPLSVAYEPELETLPVIPSAEKEPTIELEIECSLGELKEGNTRCVVVERTRLGPGFAPYQDLGTAFSDLLSPQDVALYGVLCGLGSLERTEVQQKLLDSQTFRECLDMAPQIRDLAIDFCSCRYAACLASLEKLKEPLSLDVHLHGQVANLCEQIRNKGIVQYFAPFLSVSLHRMAEAFNTDVESMQREVAKLIGQRQLEAKIDSHRKILHASHADHRRSTYQNALRVSGDFLDSTHGLILRMNLLKHDFGVHLVRQKK